jgi:hypothetical protein
MFTPALEHYAYGWGVRQVAETEPGGGKTIIAHEGGINGFNTLEERVVDDHALIVLLNNTPGANLGEIAAGIRAILYGREPAAPKRPPGHHARRHDHPPRVRGGRDRSTATSGRTTARNTTSRSRG